MRMCPRCGVSRSDLYNHFCDTCINDLISTRTEPAMEEKIEELYCFCVVGKDGSEGIPSMLANGTWMPLIGADMRRVDSLKKIVRTMERQTKTKIKLLRFTVREEIEWDK